MIARLEQANARAYEREQSARKLVPADGDVSASANVNPALEEPRVLSSAARLDGGRASPGRAKRYRLFWSLFLILCVGVAAVGWRLSDDDETRRKVVEWASQVVSSLSPQTNAPTVHTSATDVSRTASHGPEASEKDAAISAAQALELEHVLQSVTREIVVLKQGVEQLKASQEQMARNDAKIVELLKTSQEQSARDGTKIVELLKTSQEQSARDNVQIAEQLRVNQEQVARVLDRITKRNQRALTAPLAHSGTDRNSRNDSSR